MTKASIDPRPLTRHHTGAALAILVDIMMRKEMPATSRIAAANALIARAFGKPTKPEAAEADNRPVSELSSGELFAKASLTIRNVERVLARQKRRHARSAQRRRNKRAAAGHQTIASMEPIGSNSRTSS